MEGKLARFKGKLPLNVEDIKQIIPHRAPFLFVDQITEFVENERIVGIKHVLPSEPYFAGHFPGRPIMPGVIILESLAQLGAVFAHLCRDAIIGERLIVFSGADSVRFRRQVVPGDVLRLEMRLLKAKFGHWKMEGRATVGDERAADGLLTATEV